MVALVAGGKLIYICDLANAAIEVIVRVVWGRTQQRYIVPAVCVKCGKEFGELKPTSSTETGSDDALCVTCVLSIIARDWGEK